MLNAIITGLGGQPVTWMLDAPLNTIALIIIMIWLQTGFCMIVLSAAIKGIPQEIIEAAKIDGATEIQSFLRITVPMIRGPIITVSTTVFIVVASAQSDSAKEIAIAPITSAAASFSA